MIAINKTLLENTVLVNESRTLKDSGFITVEELKNIETQLPTLKLQRNLLVRFGFFFLGCFLYSSIVGVFSLFFLAGMDSHFQILCFIYAMIGIVGSEFFAKNNYHAHGLDDTFILGAQLCLGICIGVATEKPLLVLLSMTLFGFISCLRYVHTLSALIACVGLVGFFCDLIIEYKVVNTSFLPFVLFFLGLVMYFLYAKIITNSKIYHKNALTIVQVFALVLIYASMNYLVVRELSVMLIHLVIQPHSDIPFAYLFYILTFLIPIVYIVYSLIKKDKIILWIGMIILAFSFFTIRYYYAVLPPEIALIMAGVIIFSLSYWAIFKLKNNKKGITFMPVRGNDSALLSNLQAVIVNSQVDLKGIQPNDQPMSFGGGDFSGGGSTGNF